MGAAPPPVAEAVERRSALLVSTLASFLTPVQASSVVVALPSIGQDFAMDPLWVSWVITAFVLSAAIFLVPFGRLADIHGRKRVFARGVEIFTLASLLCSLAPSAGLLIAARAIQGFGSTMIFGTGVAILTSVYPPSQRGRVLGINVAAVYIGLSIGPGYLRHVKELLGGVRGCTHITELAGSLATAAFQTFAGQGLAPADRRPPQLDRCHALDAHGPVVARFYPKWYRGAAPEDGAGPSENH